MGFVLPNPSTPANGSLGDATPILANEVAIAQAIASFDGSQINAKSVSIGSLADSINPQLRYSENFYNYVDIGCTWTAVSGLIGTMTGGTIYVNGYRVIVSGVGAYTFTASSDTYVYIDYLGNVTYNPISNNAPSPSATANAVLVGIIVTNGSAIVSINQGSTAATVPVISSNVLTVSDSRGNLIYPTDPNMTTLGYRSLLVSATSSSGVAVDVGQLSVTVIVPASNPKVDVEVYCGTMYNNVAGGQINLQLTDVSNNVLQETSPYTGINQPVAGIIMYEGSIAAGSYTFKVRYYPNISGSNAMVLAGGATTPMFIVVKQG